MLSRMPRSIVFFANLRKSGTRAEPAYPYAIERATLHIESDHIIIENRSGERLRLDMEAAIALSAALAAELKPAELKR